MDGGFLNNRNGPLQSSLNAGKHKGRSSGSKKPGLLKGIGHMFRFGKHRKDGVAPTVQQTTVSEFGQQTQHAQQQQQLYETVNRKPSGPPMYQPPPAPNGGINQTDVFNARYAHYMNYDELQHQIRFVDFNALYCFYANL